ncbi:hypothetical protein RP726_04655 [Candidatus Methylospira mobilis]|uniref:hypothetical protein n=1 Tax=Candidatus Methylospira mobilis TaxID=1808979 RepID=UPI0028E7CE70|nr:hypothetical protein [Candidatus Methylospira mobilis]WNV05714.1 hypothetical protein RP726_04655 [Candidatus Methylospira mobilis]
MPHVVVENLDELLVVYAVRQAKVAFNLIGGSFLFVDEKDDGLAKYYARFGFVPILDDPLTLCMPNADIPDI